MAVDFDKLVTNIKGWKRFMNAQSTKDLDKFLDSMPKLVGTNALIAAGLTWVAAGGAVLFATTQVKEVSALRAEVLATEALKPPIPFIKKIPVGQPDLEELAGIMEGQYPDVKIGASGAGLMTIDGNLASYPAFRAAIDHITHSGKSWRVDLTELCTGKECSSKGLQAKLDISIVRIEDAELAQPSDTGSANTGDTAVPNL